MSGGDWGIRWSAAVAMLGKAETFAMPAWSADDKLCLPKTEADG